MYDRTEDSASLHFQPQTFDPQEEYFVTERRLPHWSQPGAVCFITFRTWDSMPEHVIEGWVSERRQWLKRHGIDIAKENWRSLLEALPELQRREFSDFLSERWNERLDELLGACVLRRPEFSRIVADSLRHFDGSRYLLGDFVIMPNHVHLLAAFADEEAMLAQCESWKHFTATKINRVLGRHGRFWQQDGFDHLVRSPDQFEHLCRYIAENPRHAKLRSGEYLHEVREMLPNRSRL